MTYYTNIWRYKPDGSLLGSVFESYEDAVSDVVDDNPDFEYVATQSGQFTISDNDIALQEASCREEDRNNKGLQSFYDRRDNV